MTSRGHIVICGDDADIVLGLSGILAGAGFTAHTAATLAQAHQLLASATRFDAMILDAKLPDGDGLEWLESLRACQEPWCAQARTLPVLVLSTSIDEAQARARGDALDVTDWISQPLDSDRLLSAIRTLPSAPNEGHPEGHHHEGHHKARVLHIEDDADVRQVVSIILARQATLVPAATLDEARRLLQSEQFDLVLLDLSMPDGNGLDIAADLARQTQSPPVVIFSIDHENATPDLIAATLVKSRTSNEQLRSTIQLCLNRRN